MTIPDKTRENAAQICSKYEIQEGRLKKMHIYLIIRIEKCVNETSTVSGEIEEHLKPIHLGVVCCEKINSQLNYGTSEWCSFRHDV